MACISRFATAILSGETELALGTIRVKRDRSINLGATFGDPPSLSLTYTKREREREIERDKEKKRENVPKYFFLECGSEDCNSSFNSQYRSKLKILNISFNIDFLK